MFFFRKVFGLFFIGLLFFGLVGMFRGGPGRYESAYRQGFADGQMAAGSSESAAEGDNAKAIPDGTAGTQVYYRDHSFFFPGQGLLLCLVPLFAFGLFFMSFGGRRRHGRHRGWGHCGPGYGKRGPWGAWESDPKEKSPDDIDDGTVMHA